MGLIPDGVAAPRRPVATEAVGTDWPVTKTTGCLKVVDTHRSFQSLCLGFLAYYGLQ